MTRYFVLRTIVFFFFFLLSGVLYAFGLSIDICTGMLYFLVAVTLIIDFVFTIGKGKEEVFLGLLLAIGTSLLIHYNSGNVYALTVLITAIFISPFWIVPLIALRKRLAI